MAASWYGPWFGTGQALGSGTFKALLATSTYVPNKDHTFVNAGSGADNPSLAELGVEAACTNYVRKTLSVTMDYDAGNNRARFAIADVTWTALGGADNQTVAWLLIFKDLGGADSANPLVAWFSIANYLTNGANFVADFAALGSGGNLRITAS